ncbi:MAG TPA: hypothetical protein VES95_13450 [Dermatophilaceae bacterium]|nr:hypothetical protein [Dermatophilaceae bacterium]
MPGHGYEVRVRGALGPAARAAFAPLPVTTAGGATVVAVADDGALHRVLDTVRDLGLELLGIRALPAAPAPRTSGQPTGSGAPVED